MRWQNRRTSSNINNRGTGRRTGAAIGGGGIALALMVYLLTGNPLMALQAGFSGSGQQAGGVEYTQTELTAQEEERFQYSAVALADTEDVWNSLLPDYQISYREPQMDVFTGTIETGCGIASSGMGPFYCSADEKIYMDLSFYDELVNEFGAEESDFILSYVISHEVGHHVQKVTGVLDEVNALRSRASEEEANELTIRLELQADYLAGVVARYQQDKGYLEPGDVEAAISTAWSIGDDTIQKRSQGYVVPESFTHGTSEQRARWYKKGYEAGDLSGWDTFDMSSNAHDL